MENRAMAAKLGAFGYHKAVAMPRHASRAASLARCAPVPDLFTLRDALGAGERTPCTAGHHPVGKRLTP